MRYLFLSLCLLFAVLVNAQEQTKKNDTIPTKIFTYVEEMPKPGYDLGKYLSQNIHYPDKARKENITGRVIVRFVVTETGAIANVTVVRGIGGGCDEEAIRVIEKMPPWIPAKQSGKPVSVYYTQPIVFSL